VDDRLDLEVDERRGAAQAYHRRAMRSAVVGREVELAPLRDFVTGISDGATALVLQGEAGQGKTTLWNAGVAEAEERGLRVLQACPAASETALSFSGIGDLLDPVLDEALAPLPAAQRSTEQARRIDKLNGGSSRLLASRARSLPCRRSTSHCPRRHRDVHSPRGRRVLRGGSAWRRSRARHEFAHAVRSSVAHCQKAPWSLFPT